MKDKTKPYHWEGNTFHWHHEEFKCDCEVFSENPEPIVWSVYSKNFCSSADGRCQHEAKASYEAMHEGFKIIKVTNFWDGRKGRMEF